jgi:hypothetical protein
MRENNLFSDFRVDNLGIDLDASTNKLSNSIARLNIFKNHISSLNDFFNIIFS